MTDRYDPIPDLAALIRDVAYGDRSATRRGEALLPRLGIGGNDPVTVEAIEAGLRRVLGLPDVEPAEPSLGGRATACLLAAGFVNGEHAPGRSAFHITEGVGVALGPFWAHAPEAARSAQLNNLAYELSANDIDVPDRRHHLYIPDPKRAGQDPDAQ